MKMRTTVSSLLYDVDISNKEELNVISSISFLVLLVSNLWVPSKLGSSGKILLHFNGNMEMKIKL